MAQDLLFLKNQNCQTQIWRAPMMPWDSCQLRNDEHIEQESRCMKKIADDNRRKEERVSVKDSLYVVINTQPQTMGQVVEISSTGLAFTFVDIDAASTRLSKQSTLIVDLFAGGRGVFVKGLACKLVSEIENDASSAISSLSIKRVGIRFEDLSLPQQVQINHLVRRQHLNTN